MTLLSTTNKLSLSLLLEQLCFSSMIVVFFPHVKSLQGTQLYLGSIMSVASLIGLIWNPIIGSLGDTYGRKVVLTRVLTTGVVAYILLLISNSLEIIFISRIVAAFAGPIVPILGTTASEMLKKEDQTTYYNRLPAVMAMSFILGPLVGGFLSEFNNGYRLCYTMMLVFNLINLGLVSTLPDTKKEKEDKTESLPIIQLAKKEVNNIVVKLTNVNWKEYSDIFSVKLCFELGCSLFFRSLGPSFMEFGVKRRAMGYVFVLMSACTILSNVILVNLKKTIYNGDAFGSKRLFHAAILLTITAIIMSFSNGIYVFFAGLVTLSIARTIADNTFTEALMTKASDKDRGGVSGAFESITSLCGLIIPLGAGILTDMYGLKFVIKMSFVPTLVGLLLTYRQNRVDVKVQ